MYSRLVLYLAVSWSIICCFNTVCATSLNPSAGTACVCSTNCLITCNAFFSFRIEDSFTEMLKNYHIDESMVSWVVVYISIIYATIYLFVFINLLLLTCYNNSSRWFKIYRKFVGIIIDSLIIIDYLCCHPTNYF